MIKKHNRPMRSDRLELAFPDATTAGNAPNCELATTMRFFHFGIVVFWPDGPESSEKYPTIMIYELKRSSPF
jgi:hypothetical protein